MDLTNKIKAILLESKNSDLSEEETKEFMDRILGFGEWEDIRIGLLNVLYDNDDTLWNEAITYLYYFQNKGYTYEAVKTIALLNDCLRLSNDLDSNLIWTITINIKSISYLSDYEPFQDEEVLKEMEKIKEIRKGISK